MYPFQLQSLNGINNNDEQYFKVGDYHDVIMIRSAGTVDVKYEVCLFPTIQVGLYCLLCILCRSVIPLFLARLAMLSKGCESDETMFALTHHCLFFYALKYAIIFLKLSSSLMFYEQTGRRSHRQDDGALSSVGSRRQGDDVTRRHRRSCKRWNLHVLSVQR